jgi:hypothetical protein
VPISLQGNQSHFHEFAIEITSPSVELLELSFDFCCKVPNSPLLRILDNHCEFLFTLVQGRSWRSFCEMAEIFVFRDDPDCYAQSRDHRDIWRTPTHAVKPSAHHRDETRGALKFRGGAEEAGRAEEWRTIGYCLRRTLVLRMSYPRHGV